jgi:hypothetical protein
VPWINLQGGRLLHPLVQRLGSGPLAVAGGRTEIATEYALSGDARLDLWYSALGQWSGLRFAAKDRSEIRYQLI